MKLARGTELYHTLSGDCYHPQSMASWRHEPFLLTDAALALAAQGFRPAVERMRSACSDPTWPDFTRWEFSGADCTCVDGNGCPMPMVDAQIPELDCERQVFYLQKAIAGSEPVYVAMTLEEW